MEKEKTTIKISDDWSLVIVKPHFWALVHTGCGGFVPGEFSTGNFVKRACNVCKKRFTRKYDKVINLLVKKDSLKNG